MFRFDYEDEKLKRQIQMIDKELLIHNSRFYHSKETFESENMK